jgi:F-type H+-transporting ATPase subunit delta
MSTTTSSKRYAQAVLQIAKEKNNLDEWLLDLRKIADLMHNPEFASVMENPEIPFELKAKSLREILGKVNSLALNLGYLLIAKNKFKNAPNIVEEFNYLLNEHRGVKNAEIITAIPVDNTEKKTLIRDFETLIGNKINADFKVDPNILGGIVVKVDGNLIDGSIRSKLESLEKSMAGTRK